jgi:signal transduction histidine kinase
MFRNIPMTWRVLLVSLVLGGALTFFWGRIYVKDVHETLQEQFFEQMSVRAYEGRIRLDNHVKLHHYSAELFVTQKKFLDYIEQNSPVKGGIVRRYERSPPWFPDRSIQRSFIKSRYFMLIDADGKIRETFSRGGRDVSSGLKARIVTQSSMLSAEESWIVNLQDGMFLITSQSLAKVKNPAWDRLVLATPIDDEFLLSSQGLVQSSGLLALLDESTQDILVSSDMELISRGVSLENVSKEYLVESDAFFDYGNSEVIIKLALLVPKKDLQDLLDQVDHKAFMHIFLISLTFIATFTLVFLWFIRRMNIFTQEMADFSRDKLGIDAPTVTSGGQVERTQNQFNLLSGAIMEAREGEEKSRQELLETNAALVKSLDTIKYAQTQLTQSETMAALGGLVAGVSHEINTPLGIGFTSSTFLRGRTETFLKSYHDDGLTRSELESYLEVVAESTRLIESNLSRANDLVRSFKMVAVDQGSKDRRTFNMKKYVEEILVSLKPKWKHTRHSVNMQCPEQLIFNGFPGAISQILANLIINSLTHAFQEKSEGNINIDIAHQEGELINLCYRDDGCGMSSDEVKRVFEPFFTTARNRGGSGLGMHIVFNLVTQTLGGSIDCKSESGSGVEFNICFPISIQGEKISGPSDSRLE